MQSKVKTVETLRALADELGISRERARDLFKQKGLNGTFDPKRYEEYTAALVTEASREKALEALRTKAANLKRDNSLPDCPICGKPMERDHKWDRFFKRFPVGMRCSEGGTEHFLISIMRPTFDRFAEKWSFINDQYSLLSSGEISVDEYERRISEKWTRDTSR